MIKGTIDAARRCIGGHAKGIAACMLAFIFWVWIDGGWMDVSMTDMLKIRRRISMYYYI
jgi:hypothetical protein